MRWVRGVGVRRLVNSMVVATLVGLAGCAGADGSGVDPSVTSEDGVALDGSSWTRVADPDGLFGVRDETSVRLSEVVAGGPGYVAVGSYGQGRHGEDGTVAAVWTSEDGTTWERVPHDGAVFGTFGPGQFTAASAVTTGGPGLVAVGFELDADALIAVAWLSEDAQSWTRVKVDDPRLRGATDLELSAVVDTDEGLVAVGMERGGPAAAPEYLAAWRSRDGVDWTELTLTPAADADAWGFLSTVTVHDGQVVAGGATDGFDGRGLVATVWHGSASEGLTRIPHDDKVFGGAGMPWIHGLTNGGPGLVAVGSTHSHYLDRPRWSPAAVWTSSDGATWERIAHNDAVFGDDDNASMHDVTSTSWGLIAVGTRVIGSEDLVDARFIGTVWTSPDGLTWTRLDDDGTFSGDGYISLTSITVGPHGLVAVGVVGGEGSPIGAVWTSP